MLNLWPGAAPRGCATVICIGSLETEMFDNCRECDMGLLLWGLKVSEGLRCKLVGLPTEDDLDTFDTIDNLEKGSGGPVKEERRLSGGNVPAELVFDGVRTAGTPTELALDGRRTTGWTSRLGLPHN